MNTACRTADDAFNAGREHARGQTLSPTQIARLVPLLTPHIRPDTDQPVRDTAEPAA